MTTPSTIEVQFGNAVISVPNTDEDINAVNTRIEEAFTPIKREKEPTPTPYVS